MEGRAVHAVWLWQRLSAMAVYRRNFPACLMFNLNNVSVQVNDVAVVIYKKTGYSSKALVLTA